MLLSSRAAVLAAALSLTSGCTPKCEDVPLRATAVCRLADAGAITANTPFVVQGQSSVRTTCEVAIDGGAIDLSFTASSCDVGREGEFADPVPPAFQPCQVPALTPGTYTFTTGTPVTFTIPESADAGVPLCP